MTKNSVNRLWSIVILLAGAGAATAGWHTIALGQTKEQVAVNKTNIEAMQATIVQGIKDIKDLLKRE